jgi:hypothetical protein
MLAPNSKYVCDKCEKKYNDRAGLWRHKKKCVNKLIQTLDDIDPIKFLQMENKEIIGLLKMQIQSQTSQNELIHALAAKVGTSVSHSNNHNNNKTFNLQFFLNETCKDAINMSDFVDSIKVQLSDLETTGQLGYVEGISKIFLKNLNGLNSHQRPIHCSDFKREILYIKDDDQWTKEDDNKNKLQHAIKMVASKNIKQIPEWVKSNPDCYNSESKVNDKYMKIVFNSMSGSTEEEQHSNLQKIIKNVVKEVVINKNIQKY